MNWKREEKKFLKPLSDVKEVSQDFGLLVNTVAKFTKSFKYVISSVPIAVAILNPTLHQSDKTGLRNYIINLPRSSSHERPRDIRWVVDGLMVIRSEPPRAHMKNSSNTCNIYYTISKSLSKTIRIIMKTYIRLSVQAPSQEFFRAREVCWNKSTSINSLCTTCEREAPQEKLPEFFTPGYP